MSRWRILFSYRGRLSRKRYWQVTNELNWALAAVACASVAGAIWLLGRLEGSGAYELARGGLFAFGACLAAAFVWIASAMAAKRCHDHGISGWWQILLLIPFGGILFFFAIGGRRGMPGSNQYGPDPWAMQPNSSINASEPP